MSELISRQAVIDMLEGRIQANGYSNAALVSELNRSIGYLMQLPSADQEKGTWILDIDDDYPVMMRTGWRCSNCGRRETYGMTPYCPYCGRKMEVKR